jgi:plasmid maintenance system antidote protein VapI
MAVRLEKALGDPIDTSLRMQMNYHVAQIRLRASSIKVRQLAPAQRNTSRANVSPSVDTNEMT